MLGRVFAEIGRSLRTLKKRERGTSGAATPSALENADLISLLRAPLAHPRNLNYETIAWIMAGVQSAQYLVQNMMGAKNLVDRVALLDFALDRCSVAGLVLEFGVYTGASLRAIARRAGQAVHGFDSFEGLPEDWSYFQKQGRFGLGGRLPAIDAPNVELHKGWFDATLPEFLARHPGPARFVHIDCDLYSSTRTVLQHLADRLIPGTIILFDEYLNYPGWEQHEFKAFQEFVKQRACNYRYLGFASADCSVVVELA